MNSNDFVGMVMADASPAEMEDSIKQLLFNRSVEMINDIRPIVAAQLFDPTVDEND